MHVCMYVLRIYVCMCVCIDNARDFFGQCVHGELQGTLGPQIDACMHVCMYQQYLRLLEGVNVIVKLASSFLVRL
jgi:hypothetical protein